MAASILDTQIQPDVPVQEPEKKETPTAPINPTETTTDDTQTIVVSGPLSNIYTKALQVAFSKKDDVSIVSESSAIDTTLLLQQKKQEETDAQIAKKPLYIYVTDQEHLEEEGLPKAFDELRIALSTENYQKVILCLDDGKKLSRRQIILGDYVRGEKAGKVLNSQKSLLSYLQ